jgi:hypothetical protein
MYNAAVQGNSIDQLFYVIGDDNLINAEITVLPPGENPFELKQDETNFSVIPEQRISNGKLLMNVHNGISNDGIYQLVLNDSLYGSFAFNYNRAESQMNFLDNEELNDKLNESVIPYFDIINTDSENMLEDMKSLQQVNEFWKLFIIFALLMLLAEIVILRFWK